MEKKSLIDILNHVFDHYLTSELDDEQKEDIEKGYNEMLKIIENHENDNK